MPKLQLRLATVFVLITIAAMTMARVHAIRQHSKRTGFIVSKLEAAGATLAFDRDYRPDGSYSGDFSGSTVDWQDSLFGRYAFANVVVVDGSRTSLHRSHINLILQLPRLRSLSVYGEQFGDRELAKIASLDSIAYLWLSETSVSQDGLIALERMEALTSLALRRGTFDDASIRRIADGSKLRRLYLDEVPITDVAVADIARIPSLEELHIIDIDVTDDGARDLAKLYQLSILSLDGTRITGSSLKYLRGMKHLRELSLQGMPLSAQDVEEIAELPIERLELMETSLNDQGLFAVSKIRSINWLCISDTAVTDTGLSHLAGLEHLDTLLITGLDVTDRTVSRLKSQSSVRALYR
jgi:hypothetical protein